jgi:hypothetical protein
MADVLLRPRLAWVVLPLQLACYSYIPATMETVPEQASVRVVLTSAAVDRLRATYGIVTEGSALGAKLLGQAGDSVALYVSSVPIGTGPGIQPLYQQVGVARTDVLRVDVRRVDGFRTGVLGALAAGAVALVAYQAFKGEQSVVTPPPPTPPAESLHRLTVGLSLPWP